MHVKAICLIPVIREYQSISAIKSAEQESYYVLTETDYKKDVNKVRTSLLQKALEDEECTYIRFMDDDDIILPHIEFVDDSADIFYFNYIINLYSGYQTKINYTGNPYYDGRTLGVHAWVWVAKKDFLAKMMSHYENNIWEVHCEGSFFWLKMLKLKPKIKHIPVYAYMWNRGIGGRHSDSIATKYRDIFKESMKELFDEHFH